MKRNICRVIIAISVSVFVMTTLQSCGSLGSLFQSDDFQEGFRRGWNSTAPAEYHY